MEETNKEVSSLSDSKDGEQFGQLSQDEDKSATECRFETLDTEPPGVSEDAEPMEIDTPAPLASEEEKFVSVSEQHEELENCDSVSECEQPGHVHDNSPMSSEEQTAESQKETLIGDTTAVEDLELCHDTDSMMESATKNVLDESTVEKLHVNTSECVDSEFLDRISVEKSPVTASECILPKTSTQCVDREKSHVITSECAPPVESECLGETSVEESAAKTSECLLPITSSQCLDPAENSPVPTSESILPAVYCGSPECVDQTSSEKPPVTSSQCILPIEQSECLDGTSTEKSQVTTSECMKPVEPSEYLDQTSSEKPPVTSSQCILPIEQSECLDGTSTEKSQVTTSECIKPVEPSEYLDQTSVEKPPVNSSKCILPIEQSECLDNTSIEKTQEITSKCILPAEPSECLDDTVKSQEITSECILPEEPSECLPSTSTAEEHHELRPIKIEPSNSAPNSPEMVCGYPLSDNSDAETEECQFEVTEVSYPCPHDAGTSEEVHHGCSRYQLSPALEKQAITNIMSRLDNEQIPLAQSEIFKEIYKVVDNARVTHIVFSRPIMPLKLMIPLLQKYPEVNEKMKQIKTMHANFELERILANPTFERNVVETIKKRMLVEKRPLTSQEIFQEIMRLARELGSSTKIFPYDLDANLTPFFVRNPDIYVLSEHMKNMLECRTGQFSPGLEKRLLASIMQRLKEEKFQVTDYIVVEHAAKLAAEVGVTKRVFSKHRGARHRFLRAFLNKHPEVSLKIRQVNKDVMALYPETCGCKTYKLSHSLEVNVLQRLLDKLENSTTLVAPIDIFREAVKVAKTAGVLSKVFPDYPKPSSMTKFLEIFMMHHPELRIKMQCANDLLRHSQQAPVEREEEEEDDEAPVEFEVFYVDPSNAQGNAESTGSNRIQAPANSLMSDQMDLVKPCSVVLDRSVVEQYLAPVDLSLVAEVSGRRRANLLARAKLGCTPTPPPEGKRRIARNPRLAQALKIDSAKKTRKRRSKCIVYNSKYKRRKTMMRAVSPPSTFDFLNDEYMASLHSEQVNSSVASEPVPISGTAIQASVDMPEIAGPSANIEINKSEVKDAVPADEEDTPGPSTSIQIKSEMTVEEHSLDSTDHCDFPQVDVDDDDDAASVGSGTSDYSVDIDLSSFGAWRSPEVKDAITKRLKMVYFVRTQAPRAVPCLYCHWIFRDVLRLENHVDRVHYRKNQCDKPAKKDNFQCAVCAVPFGTKLFYQLHVYEKHDPLYMKIANKPKILGSSTAVEAKLNYYSHNVPLKESTRLYLTGCKKKTVLRPSMCDPGTKQRDILKPKGFFQSLLQSDKAMGFNPFLMGNPLENVFRDDFQSRETDAQNSRTPRETGFPNAWQPNETDAQSSWQPRVTGDQSARKPRETGVQNLQTHRETGVQNLQTHREAGVQNLQTHRETGVQNSQQPVKETHIHIVQRNPLRSTSPCKPTILTQQAELFPSTSSSVSNVNEPTIPYDVPSTSSEPEPPVVTGDITGTDGKRQNVIYKICFVCKKKMVLDTMTPVLRRTGLGFCCNVCVANSVSSKDGTPVVANTLPPQTLEALHKSQVSKSKRKKMKTAPIQFIEVPSPAPKTNVNKEVEVTSDPCTYIANEAHSGVQHILNKAAAASGPSSSDTSSPLRPVAMISVKSLKNIDITGLEKDDVPDSLKLVTVQKLDNNVPILNKSQVPYKGLVANNDETSSKAESRPDTTEETLDSVHVQCQILKGKVLQCSECTKLMKTDNSSKATTTQQLVCVMCVQRRVTSKNKVLMPTKTSGLPTPNADYLCMYCRLTFSDAQTLVLHSNTCQKESVIALPCPHCSFKFTRLESLAQHTASIHHIKKRMYIKEHKCSLCSHRFLSQVTLKTHFIVDHHTCNICNQKFQTSKLCFEHMRVHLKQDVAAGSSKQTPSTSKQSDQPVALNTTPGTSKQPGLKQSDAPAPGRNWMCSICRLSFKDFKALFEHRISRHDPPLNETPTSQVLATKMVSITSESSPSMFNCKACNKSFLSLSLIRKHLRENHNLYNCYKCNKFFLIMKNGDPTMQGFLKDARFICSLCDTNLNTVTVDTQQNSDMMISNVVSLESEENSQNSSELKITSVTSLSKSPGKSNNQDEGLKISSIVSLHEEESCGQSEPAELSILSVTSMGGPKLSNPDAGNHLKSVKSKESAENMTEEMVTSDVEISEGVPMDASEN